MNTSENTGDRLFYITIGWQLVEQDNSCFVVAVHFATEYHDRINGVTHTIGLIEKEADKVTRWGASYFPKLKLTTAQAYVCNELLLNIKKEYFDNTSYTEVIDRNTFYDLINEIYTSMDDYLCDGAYLGELMQRFGATQLDLDELCFMLRDIHFK